MCTNYTACPKNGGSNQDLYLAFFLSFHFYLFSYLIIKKSIYLDVACIVFVVVAFLSVKKHVNTSISIIQVKIEDSLRW